jgi:hypothetical protein
MSNAQRPAFPLEHDLLGFRDAPDSAYRGVGLVGHRVADAAAGQGGAGGHRAGGGEQPAGGGGWLVIGGVRLARSSTAWARVRGHPSDRAGEADLRTGSCGGPEQRNRSRPPSAAPRSEAVRRTTRRRTPGGPAGRRARRIRAHLGFIVAFLIAAAILCSGDLRAAYAAGSGACRRSVAVSRMLSCLQYNQPDAFRP